MGEAIPTHFTKVGTSGSKASLTHLYVCSRQVILRQDEVVQRDIICYRHAAGVDLEDSPFGLLVRQGKLDLSVNSPFLQVP